PLAGAVRRTRQRCLCVTANRVRSKKFSRPSTSASVPTRSANSQTSSSCAMVATLALNIGQSCWLPAQLHLSTQGSNDPQYACQPQGGLPRFQVDHEAHTH